MNINTNKKSTPGSGDPERTNHLGGSLKVWDCSYSWSGGWGAYKDYYAIAVAETKMAALGWVLMEYPETDAKLWRVDEVDSSKPGVFRITGESS